MLYNSEHAKTHTFQSFYQPVVVFISNMNKCNDVYNFCTTFTGVAERVNEGIDARLNPESKNSDFSKIIVGMYMHLKIRMEYVSGLLLQQKGEIQRSNYVL